MTPYKIALLGDPDLLRLVQDEQTGWFINQADLIHPSRRGYAVTVEVLTAAIAEHGWID